MARKLFVMLAVTVLTVMPLSVNALGFGNIRVSSALNERMDAEIDLLGASEADIKDLKVSLASHNAFLRAGIERSAPLMGLRFSIKRRSNGNYYIKVSSRDSVREPFLNFLLEMNWKNGRMLREYTVLLDPPDRMQRQPTVVATPQTEAPAAVAKEEKMAEAKQEAPFVPAPVPAPVVEPEPMPAPVAEAEVDDGQPFPRTPLTEYKEKDSQVAEAEKMAEPKPAAAKPEEAMPPAPEPEMEPLIPELQAEAKPEKASPESTMVGLPADSGKPLEQPVETAVAEEKPVEVAEEQPFESIDQLYPTIPLSAYKDDASTDMTGRIPTEGEQMVPETGDLDYGITRKGDSLWKIAEKLRGNTGVTIHQVMMALLKSNPSAFINGNVHRMKVGQVLRIEDPSLLTAMSAQQAAKEYMAQTQSWDEYRQQMAAAKTEMQPEVASDTGSIAPAEEVPAEQAGELVLAAPESTEMTAGAGTSEGNKATKSDADLLREEVRKALAEAKTEQGRNTALNEHLRELEGELGNLQRSMTVQDDELAALQQQLSEINKQEEEPAQAVEAAPVAEEAAPDLMAQAESAKTPEASTTPEAVEAPAMQAETPQAAPEGDLTAQSGLAPRQEEMQTPVAPPVEVIPPPTEAPSQEPGFMDKAVATLGGVIAAVGGALSTMSISPLYLGIIGGAVVLLLVLIMIMVKRRKSTGNFQESILSDAGAADTSEAAASTAAEPASLDTNFSEESSFLSDFAISGAGAIQTEDSEVDPLTEADVFMAYGRHEAAEERLNEAVKQDPNRKELKLKLLELYNTTKNRDAFEPLAEEFYASLGDSADGDPMWEKVLVMGAEIAADNPLFSNAPAVSTHRQEDDFSDISNASLSDSQVMDIGLDTGVFDTSDFSAPATAPEEESSASLDFNLDFGDAEGEDTAGMDLGDVELPAEESTSSLDFNLGDDEETATLQKPTRDDAEGEETASIDLGAGMDFNLDSSESRTDTPEPTMTMEAPNLKDDDMSLDFDMGASDAESTASLDFDMGDETADADEGFSLDLGGEDSAAGMDLNLDASDASSGMDDMGAVDEVGTKLDLAKAYIDMGDPEGARSILDEVMDEGKDSQKQEAQQLIQQIV